MAPIGSLLKPCLINKHQGGWGWGVFFQKALRLFEKMCGGGGEREKVFTGVTAAASFWKKKRCFFIQKSLMKFKGLAFVRCLERDPCDEF